MKKIKILALVLALVFSMGIFANWSLPVLAEDDTSTEEHCTGLIPDDPELMKKYLKKDTSINTISNPPVRFDITKQYSMYTPEIFNQEYLNSCGATSVMYAYTYAANKLNNVTSREKYSTKFLYNAINGGGNNGVAKIHCLEFLAEHGALLDKDFPYVGNPYDPLNYTELPSAELTNQMIEALKTRLDTDQMCVSYSGSSVSGVKSFIQNAKNELAAGNMLSVSTWIFAIDAVYVDNVGYVGIRTSEICEGAGPDNKPRDGGRHGVVVVGYDDEMWVDINQNGVKDSGEFGAFKLANTWGPTWGLEPSVGPTTHSPSHDGYFWVAYDALYKTSQVSGGWENLKYLRERLPILAGADGNNANNTYYRICVKHYPVYYALKLTVNTADRANVKVIIGETSKKDSPYNNTTMKYPSSNSGHISCNNWVLVYDLNREKSQLTNPHYFYTEVGKVANVSQTIVDSNGQAVNTFPLTVTIGNNDGSFVPNTTMVYRIGTQQTYGDLNYDGKINLVDVVLIRQFVQNTTLASSLQFYIGDMNRDGKLTQSDVTAIQSKAG